MASVRGDEREMQARADRLAILRHAQRLRVICGQERAIKALELALDELKTEQPPIEEYLGKSLRGTRV